MPEIGEGSPPQVRGKPKPPTEKLTECWITPAGAGKTGTRCYCSPGFGDHPRRCGENCAVNMYSLSALGSPPQVRGKPEDGCAALVSGRITPAGAGKTHSFRSRILCIWDHPRRCGENFDFTDAQLRGKGSPPQVRGKLDSRSHNHVLTRITPAGAGKTNINRVARHNAEDHPRRCGENRFGFSVIFKQAGSPPQVRGKRTRTLKK